MRVGTGPLRFSTDQATYTASGDLASATLYSEPFSLAHLDKYALQADLTGATVTGTLVLQASNSDAKLPPGGIAAATAMTWTDIAGSSQTATVAATFMWNASGVGYRWVRIKWTETGVAAGAITATSHGKGPN